MFSDKRPSLIRFIQIDYWTFVAAVFMVIFWVVYLYDSFTAAATPPIFLYWLVAVTILCVAVIFWRYTRMLSVYGIGQEAKAVINGVGFFRDRGKISFIYTYLGQKYQGRATIMRTKRTKRYQIGDEIDVMVDRENPKRALIRDLFV